MYSLGGKYVVDIIFFSLKNPFRKFKMISFLSICLLYSIWIPWMNASYACGASSPKHLPIVESKSESISKSSSFQSFSSFKNGIPIAKKSKSSRHLHSHGNSIHVSNASHGNQVVFKVNGKTWTFDQSKNTEKIIPGRNGYEIHLKIKNGMGEFELEKQSHDLSSRRDSIEFKKESKKKSKKLHDSLDSEFPSVELGGEEEDDDLIWF